MNAEPPASGEIAKGSVDGELGPTVGDDADGDIIVTATSTSHWEKQRNSSNAGDGVGAVQVDEEAPQVNRRFFLGLDRLSVRARNIQRRRERAHRRRQEAEAGASDDDNGEAHDINMSQSPLRRMSTLVAHVTSGWKNQATDMDEDNGEAQTLPPTSSPTGRVSTFIPRFLSSPEFLITATLVEEGGGEVVEAQRVGFFERKGKMFAIIATCFFMVLLAGFVTRIAVVGKAKIDIVDGNSGYESRTSCDPCINRTAFTLRAILRGTPDLRKIVPSAHQAAKDMGVNLELDLDLYEGQFSDKQMADDIRASVEPEAGVDALIVTIPSKAVATAVRYAAERGMPVFGLNAGFELVSGPQGLVEDESVLFFTGMDERLGGEKAASYFLDQFSVVNVDINESSNATTKTTTHVSDEYINALFVSPRERNSAYQQRFNGYRDRLLEASNNTINVEWLEVDVNVPGVNGYLDVLTKKLSDCSYQSVLVGSGRLASAVLFPIDLNVSTKVGTFDRSLEIDMMVEKGKIDFAIDQLYHLQGWAPIHFAALYVTTGLVLAPPPSGVYLSGPVLLTKENSTTDTSRICIEEAFSVCSGANQTSNSTLGCQCTEMHNITIGGVLHDISNDTFWDTVGSGAEQGAIDMGIELIFDQFEPQESNEILYEKMATKVLSLCESGVDGLFVTLSDNVVVDAVRKCREMKPNIQIMSINAGFEVSKELNLLHHVGMAEKDAGYQAGKRMENMAALKKTFCLNYGIKIAVLNERCAGFGQAMSELGIEYLGQIDVPRDNTTLYVSVVETAVGEFSDWEGYGFLLAGLLQLPAALELKKLHASFVMGAFDTNSLLFESLETGDVLFGIDQQPYLQGYLPIPILAHAIATKQSFLDQSSKSGPRFITAPPTAACENINFLVCLSEKAKSPNVSFQTAPPQTAQPSSSTQPSIWSTSQPSLSMQPSTSPSFNPRPTLEIVQTRGHVRCGLWGTSIESGEDFFLDLCRAIAAVLFGNPYNFVGVPVTGANRFQQLYGRSVDLLLYADTHTIEREVRERTTGSGFTFSSPYYYDGIAYMGKETFVRCAEDRMRYDGCSSLLICVTEGSTSYDFIQSSFPSTFFLVGSTTEEREKMLWNGTCNVIASDRSYLLDIASSDGAKDRQFIVGDKMMTKEPLAIVTRNNDREFSDIINWVVHAMYYGEEQGLTKDSSLCQNYTNLTSNVSELNFLNAVHCVGNYGEILFPDEQKKRGMNQINDGTTGMIYSTPFGDLENEVDGIGDLRVTDGGSLLDSIRSEKESLNCGVVVPHNFAGNITKSDKLVGMNVDYCRTLAAALFHGKYKAVEFFTFSENDDSSLSALDNGTIDVLAGARVELKYDFGSSPSLVGLHYSTPYYYGNETEGDDASFLSLATREDDVVFSSFVNCVVLATIHAQENINRGKSSVMKLVSAFGSEFDWALRDAIDYSGGYDNMFENNFGQVAKEDRGRNMLNENGGPQIYSFPGLGHL